MIKDYVNEKNIQVAMTEYNDNSINREVKDQYNRSVSLFLYQMNYKTTNPKIRGSFLINLLSVLVVLFVLGRCS